jgi:anaerobic magnesium-protoporphyrin IX monomethyl ester cyclase
MARVLFTHSYFLRFDPKQWRAQRPYAPLATLFAASYLREHGHEVRLHDVMFAKSAQEVTPVLEEFKPDFMVIYDDGFNYLTKMCLTNMRDAAFEMIGMAKDSGARVLVSSSDSTDRSEIYLDAGAYAIIVGEAEDTLLEAVEALFVETSEIQDIDGLRYYAEGSIHNNRQRKNETDIDKFPLPAWDLIDIEAYRSRWMKSTGYFSINQVTTRGCPFKCNWCAKPIYGNRYNSRSPENVVEELVYLRDAYGFDHVWFCDDIFGLKPGWVKRFSELVREHKLSFKFNIQSRADLLVKENTVAELAAAGASEVWIGAESGSQKVLDAMDKGTSIEQIEQSTELMKKAGIKPCFFLQFGYPGEEQDDIKATLDMVFRLMPHDIGVSVSYPLPGTKFYENVKSQMSDKQNWTDSDELLVMFEGAYSSEFYKKLQRYVHHEFRKRKALEAVKNGDPSRIVEWAFRIPQALISKSRIAQYA